MMLKMLWFLKICTIVHIIRRTWIPVYWFTGCPGKSLDEGDCIIYWDY